MAKKRMRLNTLGTALAVPGVWAVCMTGAVAQEGAASAGAEAATIAQEVAPAVAPETGDESASPAPSGPEERLQALRSAAPEEREALIAEALTDTSALVLEQAIELARESGAPAAIPRLDALARDPARPGKLRSRAFDTLGEISPIHVLRFLSSVPSEDPVLELARLRWTGQLGEELRVFRAARSFLDYLVRGDGHGAYLMLIAEIRQGFTPEELGRGDRIRSYRIKSVHRIGPGAFGVDVRVVTESKGGEQLFLRLDYLVLQRQEERFKVRRRVLGTAAPFG